MLRNISPTTHRSHNTPTIQMPPPDKNNSAPEFFVANKQSLLDWENISDTELTNCVKEFLEAISHLNTESKGDSCQLKQLKSEINQKIIENLTKLGLTATTGNIETIITKLPSSDKKELAYIIINYGARLLLNKERNNSNKFIICINNNNLKSEIRLLHLASAFELLIREYRPVKVNKEAFDKSMTTFNDNINLFAEKITCPNLKNIFNTWISVERAYFKLSYYKNEESYIKYLNKLTAAFKFPEATNHYINSHLNSRTRFLLQTEFSFKIEKPFDILKCILTMNYNYNAIVKNNDKSKNRQLFTNNVLTPFKNSLNKFDPKNKVGACGNEMSKIILPALDSLINVLNDSVTAKISLGINYIFSDMTNKVNNIHELFNSEKIETQFSENEKNTINQFRRYLYINIIKIMSSLISLNKQLFDESHELYLEIPLLTNLPTTRFLDIFKPDNPPESGYKTIVFTFTETLISKLIEPYDNIKDLQLVEASNHLKIVKENILLLLGYTIPTLTYNDFKNNKF